MKNVTEYLNSGSIKQQNKKRLGALLICATAILLCIALLIFTVASITAAIRNRKANEEPEDDNGIPTGYTTTMLDVTQISQGTLLLIDDMHPCMIEPEVVSITDRPTIPDSTSAVYSAYMDLCFVTKDTLTALNKMMADFYAATQNDCVYLTKTEHGTILTLTYYDEATNTKTNSIYDAEAKAPVEEYRWIFTNAATYGFVPAYDTEGKENVFRYVGAEHAKAMDALNADNFPEYLEALKARCGQPGSARSVTVEGVRYKIYYQAATADTPVWVPEKNTYVVSGNNVDGYIITETVSTNKK